jgi:outer membrane protein
MSGFRDDHEAGRTAFMDREHDRMAMNRMVRRGGRGSAGAAATLLAAAVAAAMGAYAPPLTAQEGSTPPATIEVAGRVPLSLEEAMGRAAGNAPAVLLAGIGIDEAQAQVGEARSALLPHVGASAATMNRTFNLYAMGFSLPTAPGEPPLPALVGPFGSLDARVRMDQTLFDAAGYQRLKAARVAVAGDEAERESAQAAAAQRAALSYLQAGRAEAILEARIADEELAAELLDLARSQVAAGVGTAIDVTRAQTRQVTAAGAVLVAGNEVEQAQIELARSLGIDPSTRFELTAPLDGATAAIAGLPSDRDALIELALENRPELKTAAAMGATANAARSAIRAERLPRVDLFADYGVSGLHANDAIATRQIGVQVSVPLLDGFGRRSRMAEQEATIRRVAIRSDDLAEQVKAEVGSALLDLRTGQQEREIAAQRLLLAEQELELARERFANGVANNIELIQAQTTLNQARDAEVAARFTVAVAQTNLARAVGTITPR